ncbi:3'-5' exonuclease [Alkalicoccus urumqiensis]|uniref:DNA polymerase III subunit epsilon n=1 Tax=Alkalicoccus urumqiensis TaxID=1548213 RepID=A0A2P6MGJ9_ALKUR|nr:exonuclease domain-containing protein [Alkalicoccus urumqiensis]PRO65360.1 DNA polymerase III subunit epsilon [Alkalicoccus urumqiensis]
MFWKRKQLPHRLIEEMPLNTPIKDLRFTVFDTEATGFAVGGQDRLIEIGAVQVEGLEVTDHTFQTYVNPGRSIPPEITELTGISAADTATAPLSLEAVNNFFAFAASHKSCAWAGHYLAFDITVLKKELQRAKASFQDPMYIDTLDLIGFLAPSRDMRDLQHYALDFGTPVYGRHSALGDALTTAHLLVELLRYIEDRGRTTLGDLRDITTTANGWPST